MYDAHMEHLNRPEQYAQDPNDADLWNHKTEVRRQIRKVRFIRAEQGGAALIIARVSEQGQEGFELVANGRSSDVFDTFDEAACANPRR